MVSNMHVMAKIILRTLISQHISLQAHGKSLVIEQRLSELGIGGVVWDCGVSLAHVLDSCPALVESRRVRIEKVEMGEHSWVDSQTSCVGETFQEKFSKPAF